MPVIITQKRDADHDEAVLTGEIGAYESLSVKVGETGAGEVSHVIGHDSVNVRCSHNSTRAVSLEGKEHILNACTAFALISAIEGLEPDPQPGETWELFGRDHKGNVIRRNVEIIDRTNSLEVDGIGFFQSFARCSVDGKEVHLPISAFFSARQLP